MGSAVVAHGEPDRVNRVEVRQGSAASLSAFSNRRRFPGQPASVDADRSTALAVAASGPAEIQCYTPAFIRISCRLIMYRSASL